MNRIISYFKSIFNGGVKAPDHPEANVEEFSTITDANGQKMLVDKAYKDYHNSTAQQPTQLSLNKVLNRVSHIRVIEGGMQGDKLLGSKVLLNVSDMVSLDEFRSSLQIVEGGNGHCMCHGEPTFELLSFDNKCLAVIALHHGESIRWNSWKDDAGLVDGRFILHWLAQRGVNEPLKEWEANQVQQDDDKQAWNRWIMAMPDCLKEVPTDVWDKTYETKDVTPLIDALEQAYPNISERLLNLFGWFGSGAGSWTQFQAYELVAQNLLLQYPVETLIKSAQENTLVDIQQEGAARLFASAAFQKYNDEQVVEPLKRYSYGYTGMMLLVPDRIDQPAAIPESLRKVFLDFYQNSDDEEKRNIAFSAFAV